MQWVAMRKRDARLVLVVVLLMVMGLGLRGITFDDLWYDEQRTMWYAGIAEYGPISLGETWARVAENAVQTPGYYLFLNLWEDVAGDSVFANRYPSVLFGLLTVAFTYRVGEVLVSREVGVSAAVILGLSGFFVIFLHEMRTYTLVMRFVALAVLTYWRLINGRRDVLTQVLFVLTVAGLPYTHYYAVMVAGALALYHLLFVRKDREWWRVPLLMAAAALMFIPWVDELWAGTVGVSGDESRVIYALSPGEAVGGLVDVLANGSPLLWLFLALVGMGYGGRGGQAAWFLAVLTLALALVANMVTASLSQTRYLLMAFPLLALLAALGASRLARQGVPLALTLGLMMTAGVVRGADPRYVVEVHNADWYFPWARMVAAVQPVVQPGDALMVQLPRLTGAFAHEPLVDHYLYGQPINGAVLEYPFYMTQADYIAQIQAQIDGRNPLWVARQAELVDDIDERILRETLAAAGYIDCGVYVDEPDLRLDLYAQFPAEAALGFGGDVGVTPLWDAAAVGESLAVTLGWRVAADFPTPQYSYGLHLLDASGGLVRQADAGVPGGVACTRDVLALGGLPPGDYTLTLVVYAWATGETVSVDGAARAILGEVALAQAD